MYRRSLAVLGLLLTIPFGAVAAPPQGQPYIELPITLEVESPNKVEVREFFWYGCSHCYSLEPGIESWLKRKPANATFVRTPAAVGSWALHAQAYYAFETLGVLERVHVPFFKAIHQQNRRFNNEAAIAQFAVEHGIDNARFREAFNSFGVRLKLDKARRLYEAAGIDGVPNLVIAGKYVTSPGIAGDPETMFKVVDELVKKAGRAPAKPAKNAK